MQSKQRVTISRGNRKLGAIMNVSTEPVLCCPKGIPCAEGGCVEDQLKEDWLDRVFWGGQRALCAILDDFPPRLFVEDGIVLAHCLESVPPCTSCCVGTSGWAKGSFFAQTKSVVSPS